MRHPPVRLRRMSAGATFATAARALFLLGAVIVGVIEDVRYSRPIHTNTIHTTTIQSNTHLSDGHVRVVNYASGSDGSSVIDSIFQFASGTPVDRFLGIDSIFQFASGTPVDRFLGIDSIFQFVSATAVDPNRKVFRMALLAEELHNSFDSVTPTTRDHNLVHAWHDSGTNRICVNELK
jgi:hypothetical protein